MSTAAQEQRLSRNAGADLRTKQFYAVKISGANVVLCSAAGEDVLGILANKPNTNESASVVFAGLAQAKAGGNITAGDKLKTGADGRIIAATKGSTNTSDAGVAADPLVGSNVIGTAMEDAVADDVFQMMITREGAVPTTAA